jgi:hypothetical protein
VGVALIGGKLLSNQDARLERALIASCERGDVLRGEVTVRGAALRKFLAQNPSLAGRAELAAAFKRLEMIDCERIVRSQI